LNPLPWAPADQMLNGLGKMIEKCCAFAFRIVSSHKEIHLPAQISGALSFSAKTGFSSLTQAAKVGKEWSRESPYQPGKWTFQSTIAPCFCHITLFYLITELPMNLSWDKGIKHLSS